MAGEHLLVIDDSPTLLKVETTLTRAGQDTAADGGRPWRWCEVGVPFTSSSLTGSSRAAIRRNLPRAGGDEALGRVPVVVMAPRGEDLESRFARAPNVVDYISKPFRPTKSWSPTSSSAARPTAGA
jgi:hypothetical protein